MLRAAIYRADPGSVVVESGDLDYALAGGNVCAVASRRGIAGFVLDGLIRDLGEVRELGFPVFARGVIPKPGVKRQVTTMAIAVQCGGVHVSPGQGTSGRRAAARGLGSRSPCRYRQNTLRAGYPAWLVTARPGYRPRH